MFILLSFINLFPLNPFIFCIHCIHSLYPQVTSSIFLFNIKFFVDLMQDYLKLYLIFSLNH